jgi:DNA gyrase subunit A
MAICFRETDVRVMGRDAVGVRGIRLREGDYVIGAARTHPGGTLLTVTENGFGKRTDIEEYLRGEEAQKRGGYGLKNYNLTEKTGPAAAVRIVDEDDDVLINLRRRHDHRMAAADINVYSRYAQGVILMRVADGAKVISLAAHRGAIARTRRRVPPTAPGTHGGVAARETPRRRCRPGLPAAPPGSRALHARRRSAPAI